MPDFTLPELGENITAGDVLRVLVKPGDTLDKDQPVLELETDKATIEVPSSVSGRVTEIKVKAGDKVKVGQAILSVDEGGAAAGPPRSAESSSGAGAAAESRSGAGSGSGGAARQESERAEPSDAGPGKEARRDQSRPAVAANSAEKVPEGGLEQHAQSTRR